MAAMRSNKYPGAGSSGALPPQAEGDYGGMQPAQCNPAETELTLPLPSCLLLGLSLSPTGSQRSPSEAVHIGSLLGTRQGRER